MPYIAFVDMVGTRASALRSSKEYTSAISTFAYTLKQLYEHFHCKIYGYSDNAYLEFQEYGQMVDFLQLLRELLMNEHRYFTAAVDTGSLLAKQHSFGKQNGFAMEFTSSVATDIYIRQRQFSGIGISLSDSLVKENEKNDTFCTSIFHCCDASADDLGFEEVIDLAYRPVTLEQLRFVFADYIVASSMNVRAGRYYLTPIISMIKCLDPSVVLNEIEPLVSLLSLHSLPSSFNKLTYIDTYSMYFLLALVDRVFSMQENSPLVDSQKICEYIIKNRNKPDIDLVGFLSNARESVITAVHKREFLEVLYNVRMKAKDE